MFKVIKMNFHVAILRPDFDFPNVQTISSLQGEQ